MSETPTIQTSDGHAIGVFCAHDALVLIELIQGNPKNPNTHPVNQIDLLAKVIQSQGWRAPITVSTRSKLVVKGHGRLAAAKALGCEKVPVDYQDYDTEADEIADLLADNKIAELSAIDNELEQSAKSFLEDDGFDLELAGFEMEEDKMIEDPPIDADLDDVAKSKTWISVMANREDAEGIVTELKKHFSSAQIVVAQGKD